MSRSLQSMPSGTGWLMAGLLIEWARPSSPYRSPARRFSGPRPARGGRLQHEPKAEVALAVVGRPAVAERRAAAQGQPAEAAAPDHPALPPRRAARPAVGAFLIVVSAIP